MFTVGVRQLVELAVSVREPVTPFAWITTLATGNTPTETLQLRIVPSGLVMDA